MIEALLGVKEFTESLAIDEKTINEMDKLYETEKLEEERRLSAEEKENISEESGFSDEIIDSIDSLEECNIYKDAGLVEIQIDDKACLIKPDLNLDRQDGFGRTNKERMEQGLAPLDSENKPYELHHIGQKSDSHLAELTMQEHRGQGNDSIMHDKSKDSEIDRNKFNTERAEHWQSRVEGLQDE